MPSLKSRAVFPPGEFQVLHPEAGQQTPFKGSFSEAVAFEMNFRLKNPALVSKYGWSLDPNVVASDVDAYNAQRMIAAGFFSFVDIDAVPPTTSGGAGRGGFARAAAAADSALTGLAIYLELFSGGTKPVPKPEAERRAAVCLVCPLNNTKLTLRERFVAYVAKGLTELAGVLRDMDMTTSLDKQLGTCDACDCPLFAKVHVPIDSIERNMKPRERAKLDPRCWITQPAGS